MKTKIAILLAAFGLMMIPFLAQARIDSFDTAAVTCTSTPTPLRTKLPVNTERTLLVQVPATAPASIFIGRKTVTVDTGIEVAPGQTYSTNDFLKAGVVQYCVSAIPVTVRVQETN